MDIYSGRVRFEFIGTGNENEIPKRPALLKPEIFGRDVFITAKVELG